MRSDLKILTERYERVLVNNHLQQGFNKDLVAFEQYLVQEGLWDTIKQKGAQLAGGAKNALLQPLVKMVLDKIAQSDPEGYKQLQQAANDPQKLQALLNSPEVQQQQQAVSQDVATATESIDDILYEDYLNEAYGYLVQEAWVDPKTGRFVRPGTPGAVERKSASNRDARGRFVKDQPIPGQQPATEPPVIQQPATEPPVIQQPNTATQDIKQGAAQLGKGLVRGADQLAIKGLQGLGKGINLTAKAGQGIAQSKIGQGVRGFIGKAVNWVKKNPKISLAAGLALLATTGGFAAIGAGGIAPLIAGTVKAGLAGAGKGGIIGGIGGGVKDLASQAQNVKSLKDINWKQAGKEALKKGALGAAIGGAVGAGGHVAGKAIQGVGKLAKGFGGSSDAAGNVDPRGANYANAQKDYINQANRGQPPTEPTVGSAEPTHKRGLRPGGVFSNEYINQANPHAKEILEILKDPMRFDGFKASPHMFDPAQNPSAMYNAGLNLSDRYTINGMSLDKVIEAGFGRNNMYGAREVLRDINRLAAEDPESALKLLSAKLGKGLAALDTVKQ